MASAKMKLSIEGLSGALDENVDAHLSLIDENRIDNTPYFKGYIESEIKKALRALGYYSPRFYYHVNEPANSSSSASSTLVITVEPGEPVLIKHVDVNITGEGQNDKDYIALLQNETPKIDTILNHGVYDSFRKKLQSIALAKGYFESEMSLHQLAVAEKLKQAFWQIDFNTGKRYRFGSVTFADSVIRESYLRNIIPFDDNEYYTSDQLSLFTRRLSSTNWFNSVSVIPLFRQVTDDKALPLYVMTTPRKKNIVDLGLGYSTDIGLRGKIGLNRPRLNDRGYSFQTELSLSAPEQSLSAVYKMPLESSPLEYYYTIQGGYKRIDNNDTDSDSFTVSVIRNWDSFEGWQRSLGLNAMLDNFTQADDEYETFLLYPSFTLSRIRSDGRLFPMWGDSQHYSLEAASADLASDINFIRFQIQHAWIRSINENHRFIARANFGIIQADEFDRVPPSFRFFAGGDRSVRGYSYQSISPEDSSGKLKGASKLLTGTLEYQYRLTDSWWAATFMDTGEAADRFNIDEFYSGAGVGIRWASPIGSIRLDVATPIDTSSRSVHFYIGLGTEL